jgi:hypothetical protein
MCAQGDSAWTYLNTQTAKYAGMDAALMARLKELEDENRGLR